MFAKPATLSKCNPNRHGWVKLLRYDTEDGAFYYVVTPHDEDGAEFQDEADARACYAAEVAAYASAPNWQAQAEYDAQCGEPLPVYPSPLNY